MLELINVVVAAFAAFAIGAPYYMALSKPWMADSGVPVGEDGKPEGGQAMLLVRALICQLVVAGMMRHLFEMAAITGTGKGLLTGLGIGLFFITPWIALNNGYAMRPNRLVLIDGGYAVIACSVMGIVLTLF